MTIRPSRDSTVSPGRPMTRLIRSLWSDSLGGLSKTTMSPDRKSTRLNSSHANISYAVFCLKTNIRRVGDDACDLGIPRACQHPGPNRLRLDRAAGSGDDGVLLYGAPACPPLHAHRIEPFLL